MRFLCLLALLSTTLASANAQESVRYLYDTQGRLVKTYSETGPYQGTLAHTQYDSADNRTNYRIKNVLVQLTTNQFIQSADGRFKLIMQGDGNLVLYFGASALWVSPGTYGTTNTASFQTDGNLVVYGPSGPRWASSTYAPGAELSLQNDGNLVVYAMDGTMAWQSNTGGH